MTARNRFYQVPHCSGMGFVLPQTLAAMRATKAQGGRGVVNTEYCSIHPTSDDAPYPYATLWDADDIKSYALMVEQVHAHGALAGVEFWHGGDGVASRYLFLRGGSAETRGISKSAVTSSDGAFRFTGLKPGKYRVNLPPSGGVTQEPPESREIELRESVSKYALRVPSP